MEYEVRLARTTELPTAVVAASTTWAEFPARWKVMLDDVWAFIRVTGLPKDGRNVMLYKDDVPNVEVGVRVRGPFTPTSNVVPSRLPAGDVAMTVHCGPPDTLAASHKAILDWCVAHGLELAGPRWEIYGHWRGDGAEFEIEVYWLLRTGTSSSAVGT